uniref:Interleukin-1 receptor type 1-like isoform X3 n=1 Tax=Geotrypetes seraphini TaxID=260995 RepID=A0A6P8R6P8_GEOSA|nr:interleukin-1 receptor type 1-like isoform X3 [Geotrypetes seraphini]
MDRTSASPLPQKKLMYLLGTFGKPNTSPELKHVESPLLSKKMDKQSWLLLRWICFYLYVPLNIANCRIMKAPKIIYPQNNTFLEVEQASKQDITCKAFIGYNVSFEDAKVIPIYWLINQEFADNYLDVEEVSPMVSSRGEAIYLESVLIINKVIKAFYNASFTCAVTSASGRDVSFFYLIRPKHPGMPAWQHAVLVTTVLICLSLLTICIYNFLKIDIILFYLESCNRKTKKAVADVVEDFLQKSRTLIIILSSISCEDGQEQTLYEQHIGLYNALIRNKMKVILIELEEIIDFAAMPESLKYIKHKQGAIRWKGGFTVRARSPNTKFWKNVRYQMSRYCFQETHKYDLGPAV